MPCFHSNFDQFNSVDAGGTARYRITPYQVKVQIKLHTISPEEIEMRNTFKQSESYKKVEFLAEKN